MRLKKIVTLLCAISIVIGLSACGSSSSEEETLSLWLPPFATGKTSDVAEWNSILTNFEKEQKVKVDVTIIPWETFADKVLAGFSGGQGPDVVYMYNELIGDYIHKGALQSLDGYMKYFNTDDYLYLDRGKVNGEQYSIPFMVGGARVLFYNKDLLSKAGISEPPKTWDDLLADGEKLVAAGITPLTQAWGDPSGGIMNDTFYEFLWQAGGDILNSKGTKTAFNSAAGVKAAQFLLELKNKKILNTDALSTTTETAIDAFAKGKSAFFVQNESEASTFAKAGINYGWVDSLKGEKKATFFAADSIVMSNASQNKVLAAKLMAYLTSATQMKKFHSWAKYPPINKSEASDSEFKTVYTEKDLLHTLPVAAGSQEAYDALYSNLQKMLMGQKTPKQALQDAEDTGNKALEEGQQ